MSTQTLKSVIEVLDILQVESETLVLVKLLSGHLDIDMVFKAEETGEQWRVLSFGHIPAKSHAEGVRGISLEKLNDSSNVHPGMVLISES